MTTPSTATSPASYDQLDEEFACQDSVGWTIDIEGCEITNPDAANTTVECSVVNNIAISDALDVGPFAGNYVMKVKYPGNQKLGVTFTKTAVHEALFFQFPAFEFSTQTWRPFVQWLEQNHSEDVDVMLAGEVPAGN